MLAFLASLFINNCPGMSSSLTEEEKIVDLSERKTIISLIDPAHKTNQQAIRAMHTLGIEMNKSDVRVIQAPDGKGAGQAFRCHPEALKQLIPLVRGKAVLEVAGASGENSAFLAFSGAKQVFVNELQTSEEPRFKKLISPFPSSIKTRIQPLWGDIFETLKTKQNILKPGIHILCRTFLHMLDDNQITTFLTLIKPVLGKEGTIVLSVNSFSPLEGRMGKTPSPHTF